MQESIINIKSTHEKTRFFNAEHCRISCKDPTRYEDMVPGEKKEPRDPKILPRFFWKQFQEPPVQLLKVIEYTSFIPYENGSLKFAYNHPNLFKIKKFVESFFRLIRNLWAKIIGMDLYNSLPCRNKGEIPIPLSDPIRENTDPTDRNSETQTLSDINERIHNIAIKTRDDGTRDDGAGKIFTAIQTLQTKNVLSSNVFIQYKPVLEKFAEDRNIPFLMNLEYIHGGAAAPEEINQIKKQKGIMALPFIVRGIKDHIMTLIINFEEETIEFYDSQGLTSYDRANQKLKFCQASNQYGELYDLSVREFLDKIIIDHRLNGFILKENTRKEQQDSHNCGVYVLNHLKTTLVKKLATSPDHTIQPTSPLSFFEANYSKRQELMEEILTHYKDYQPEPMSRRTFFEDLPDLTEEHYSYPDSSDPDLSDFELI